MSDSVKIVRTGPSLVPMLTVLFVALKLTNVIQWSWWWVLSPIWIALSIVAIILIALIFFMWLSIRKEKKWESGKVERAKKTLENFEKHHLK